MYDVNRKIKTVRPNQPPCVTKRNPKKNDNAEDANAPMQTATLNAESHAILSKTVCWDHFEHKQPNPKTASIIQFTSKPTEPFVSSHHLHVYRHLSPSLDILLITDYRRG